MGAGLFRTGGQCSLLVRIMKLTQAKLLSVIQHHSVLFCGAGDGTKGLCWKGWAWGLMSVIPTTEKVEIRRVAQGQSVQTSSETPFQPTSQAWWYTCYPSYAGGIGRRPAPDKTEGPCQKKGWGHAWSGSVCLGTGRPWTQTPVLPKRKKREYWSVAFCNQPPHTQLQHPTSHPLWYCILLFCFSREHL
jgi:hypothetical protein